MKDKESKIKKADELRKRAEEKLRSKKSEIEKILDSDTHRLVHELQVHQIELEMQNEELRETQVQLEESRQKYSDLYDFAPVGYMTFDENGLIQEANLTAASLLGVKRGYMTNKPFSFFIHTDDRDIFYLHLRKVFKSKTKQSCEARLKGEGGIEFNGQLDSILREDSSGNNECRTSVIDVTRQKKGELALRYERNKVVSILNAIEDGIYIVNQQYDIEYVNSALIKEFYSFEGQKCYRYFHNRQTVCPWCKNQEVFAGKTVRWEWYSPKNQKSYNIIDTPLKNVDGSISKLEIFHDITKRKQAEEFTKSIFENIGEGIVVVDRQYRIVTANRAFCNQVKMPAETIQGRHCYEVSHHIDKPCYEADEDCPVRQTFTTGEMHTCTHRHYDMEGNRVYVEIRAYPMKDKAGHVTSAIEIITDITKTVRLEEALRNKINELNESQERFQKISDTAQDAIVMVDNEGNISYWNPAAEKIFGYKEEEANGRSLHQLIVPDKFYEKYIKGFKRFKDTGQGTVIGKTLELSAMKKERTEFPVELSLSAVKIRGRWNAIGIVRDITKRKQAEKKILRDYYMQNAINSILQVSLKPITLEEQLEHILEIVVLSPWITFQPQSCIFLVEDDPEVLVMKACHSLPRSLPITCKKVPFGKCLCGRAASTGEVVFVDRCDGYHEMPRLNPSPHGHYCIPIFSGQRMLGIINLYLEEGYKINKEDEKFLSTVANTLAVIIERKQAEEALKQAKDELELRVQERTSELTMAIKKLEISLREKQVLLSEIHHRVKNNMQVISSMLDLQSEYIKDKKNYYIFKESQNRIKSMALIHEKLYRSKDLANINFSDYIRSLTDSLLRSYRESAGMVDLKMDIENISLGIDTAIPCGLIINEIFTNSLKHAFPKNREGEIKIALRKNDEDEIELTISDNGVGIPEELNFRNTESLGLQLVVTLTEHQLQGKIEHIKRDGTTFYIKFKEVQRQKKI